MLRNALVKLMRRERRERHDPLAELQAFLEMDVRRTSVVNDRYAALRGMNGPIVLLDEDHWLAPPHPSALSALPPSPRGEREARIAFRDGARAGVLEILSVDAEGKCIVHEVSGLALMNLAVKAVEQIRRGAST